MTPARLERKNESFLEYLEHPLTGPTCQIRLPESTWAETSIFLSLGINQIACISSHWLSHWQARHTAVLTTRQINQTPVDVRAKTMICSKYDIGRLVYRHGGYPATRLLQKTRRKNEIRQMEKENGQRRQREGQICMSASFTSVVFVCHSEGWNLGSG
jgi:hypothetical protein